VEMAGPMYYIQWRLVGREMSYNRDGWTEVLCKVEEALVAIETSGPEEYTIEGGIGLYY
jgi:hypothetical protein